MPTTVRELLIAAGEIELTFPQKKTVEEVFTYVSRELTDIVISGQQDQNTGDTEITGCSVDICETGNLETLVLCLLGDSGQVIETSSLDDNGTGYFESIESNTLTIAYLPDDDRRVIEFFEHEDYEEER